MSDIMTAIFEDPKHANAYKLGDSGLIFTFSDEQLKKSYETQEELFKKAPQLKDVVIKETNSSFFEVGNFPLRESLTHTKLHDVDELMLGSSTMLSQDLMSLFTGKFNTNGVVLHPLTDTKAPPLVVEYGTSVDKIREEQVFIHSTGAFATLEDYNERILQNLNDDNIIRLPAAQSTPFNPSSIGKIKVKISPT